MAESTMKRYTARGVVLGTIKYGDKGVVVQMLTSSHGRQSYMVQGLGSRRGHSKLALFQPLFALEFEGLESPRMQMHRLGEVHNGIVLQSTPFDIKKSTIALFMAEVLHRLVKESEANELLFDFVWGSIEALDAATEGVANFHLWFLSHLCRLLGFSPGNEYMPDAWFNIAEGLYTLQEPPREYRISQENALILRDMLECDVRYIAEIGLNRHQRVEFLSALVRYYGYHLDTINSVQSIRILQEVF
jgi:DNA repair protein RecO (recombination protein O)